MPSDITTRRFEARPAVERYAEQSLRKPLAWGEGRIRIVIPEGGTRSLVYFVSLEEKPPIVVQAFSDAAECEQLARALSLRDKNDIPIPKLLHKSGGLLDRKRFGYSLIAMSLIPGEAIKSGVPNQNIREGLASSLVRLHRVREKKWGVIGSSHRGSIREAWYGAVTAKLHELEGGFPGLDRNMMALIDRWFKEALAAAEEPAEFHLCHGNLSPSSIIYAKTGEVGLVDCARMEFSCGAADLAELHNTLFLDEKIAWEDFLHRYFGHFSKPERQATLNEIRILDALFYLNKLRRRIFTGMEDEEILGRLMKIVSAAQ